MKKVRTEIIPTSSITAQTVEADGFVLSQSDHAGITTVATRRFTDTGMTLTQTDGRGNVTTTRTDQAGRTVSVTDAAGNTTTTAYDAHHDQPAQVTDAQGNTACYRYDIRGRKVAEWGTGIQPAVFAYDEADRLTALTTFRASGGDIIADPGERTDGDTTAWTYDAATGLELSKTYADNTSVVKTYDAYNRLATETDARGNVKTHSYEHARGLLLGTTYSDGTPTRSYQYNHLGQPVQVTDEAGIRTLGYNSYGERETDSLLANGVTHLITETRDSYGRSTGYTYAKNGTVQQTVTTGYGTDGRIATAGFLHGGAEKQFGYSYLAGSNLLQTLAMPNAMTLTQSYETARDLLTGMSYKRGGTVVAERTYTYDTLGRPQTRRTVRNGRTVNDSFTYNNRSELTGAMVSGEAYSYAYDNIGNRKESQEAAEEATTYTANALNQYTAIDDFAPTYDADGNQTLVKTSTGIWSVQYNAENRPITFTNNESNTVVECTYDSMGRRATKQVTENGNVTLNQRYIYRGYLQIAACDQTRSGHPCLWLITWDPTQPVATRPLAIQKDGTWYCYGWDLTKNICEVFGQHGYIRTTYAYTSYGAVTADGNVTQPIQWSSEYADTELGLVYYNYRHYNPEDGRWIGCERIFNIFELNLYEYIRNNCIGFVDELGLRRVSGMYTDGNTVVSYDYDVAIANENGNCLLRLSVLINFKYEGTGNQQGVDQLFQQVEDLFQRNLSSIKVEIKEPRKANCCCSSLAILFVVARNNANWVNQPAPFIQPKSKPAEIIYNPSGGSRSDARRWKSNNPSTALHEILHLFGVADEYYDKVYYPDKKGDKLPEDHQTSAMGINANNMKNDFVKPRHIEDIINRANIKNKELKDCELSITR